MNLIELKSYLGEYLQKYHDITNLKKAIHCLNPNHTDNNPSMFYTSKYDVCKCFGCGIAYDIFDIVGIDYPELTSFFAKKQKVIELFNIKDNSIVIPKKKVVYSKIDYSNYFKKCINNRSQTDYLYNRGIDDKLLEKYRIGYDSEKLLMIFPLSKNCYFARSTVGEAKYKTKNAESILWNEDILNECDDKSLIFITEGIIDGLSLKMVDPNIKVIALNGNTNYKRFINLVKEKGYKGYVFIALDNDSSGIKFSTIMKQELDNLDIKNFNINIVENVLPEYNDLNEALIKDPVKFKKTVSFFYNTITNAINKISKYDLQIPQEKRDENELN